MSKTTAVETENAPEAGVRRDRGGKYLTFVLGKEEFGLAILKVREIIGFQDVTAVPRTPGYVEGVINLRGQVITVMDLRSKFGMDRAGRTEHTCIIVTEIVQNGRRLCVGVIVDKVSEVLNISAENVEDAPTFGMGVNTDFIVGMGKVGQNVKILLDIDRVLDADEVAELSKLSRAA